MELIPISCHHCGAPLQIPPQAELVTCNHCLTQLAVCRNESVAWTEEIEDLQERTEQLTDATDELAARVTEVEYARSVERLDRRYAEERRDFEQGHGGDPVVTYGGAAVMAIIAGGVFGLILMEQSATIGWSCWIFAAFLAGCQLLFGFSLSKRKRLTQQRYARLRSDLYRQHFGHPDDPSESDVP